MIDDQALHRYKSRVTETKPAKNTINTLNSDEELKADESLEDEEFPNPSEKDQTVVHQNKYAWADINKSP